MILVVGNVRVNNKVSIVISLILRFAGSPRFFRDGHRGSVCVRVFIGMSVRVYI